MLRWLYNRFNPPAESEPITSEQSRVEASNAKNKALADFHVAKSRGARVAASAGLLASQGDRNHFGEMIQHAMGVKS